MASISSKQQNLPVSWYMLVATLVAGILILVPLYWFYNAGYLSTELTIGLTILVFVGAAGYESYLFYLITRVMLNRVNKEPDDRIVEYQKTAEHHKTAGRHKTVEHDRTVRPD